MALLTYLNRGETRSESEKRLLAKLPALPVSRAEFNAWPRGFDGWFGDHLGLRQRLLDLYNAYVFALGDANAPYVTTGKDGYYFLGQDVPDYAYWEDPFGDFSGRTHFVEGGLETNLAYFKAMKRYLASRGIRYYVAFASSKHRIYPDKLPDTVNAARSPVVMDQLISALREETDVPVIHFQEAMDRKRLDAVYYKTDTHWTPVGASFGYELLQARLFEDFPDLKAVPLAWKPGPTVAVKGDLTGMLGVHLEEEVPSVVFTEGCTPKQVTPGPGLNPAHYASRCETGKERLLLLGDSFGERLRGFFSRQFAAVLNLENWRVPADPDHYVWDAIDQFKPTVFIEEMGERSVPCTSKEATQRVPSKRCEVEKRLTARLEALLQDAH